MHIKHHITAGCYLVRKVNETWEIVLLYKKWSDDNQGWNPPKGHVEEGESLAKAAIRETTEETGYRNMKIIEKLEPRYIEYPWNDGLLHKKWIHYFLAILENEERKELKLSEQETSSTVKVEWMSLDEAEKNLMFDDEKELLRTVKTKLMRIGKMSN